MGSEVIQTQDLVINYVDDDVSKGASWMDSMGDGGAWKNGTEERSSWKRGVYCDLFLVLNFLV